MPGVTAEAHTGCMETTYLTYVAQAQSGSLGGPPIEWPRFRRRRLKPRGALVRFPQPATAAVLL
jgi:hypothetical protein